MLRFTLTLLLALALAPGAAAQFYGSERAGTDGFQSLQIPIDARGAALGEAAVAMADDASALFWNPALASRATLTNATVAGLATARYHVDTDIHYLGAIRRLDTPFGVFNVGLSVQALDGGRMDETTELQPDGTGRTFGYSEVAAGLTVSQALTDLFSYGVTAKYVRLATADVSASAPVFDLGVYYQVGTTGVALGVAIRNFAVADATPGGSVEVILPDGSRETRTQFEGITPPTQFMLGVTYDVLRSAQHGLTLSSQLANPADNSERLSLGAEYLWSQTLAVRGGYQIGRDESSLPSFGFGFLVPDFGGPALRIDYGFSTRDRLGAVHRVGLDVRF